MNAKDKARMHELAVKHYWETRKTHPTYPVQAALSCAKHSAKAQVLWDKFDGWEVTSGREISMEPHAGFGPVRIRLEEYPDYRVEDMFDPSAYDDPEAALQAERDVVARDGAWGVVGEYWDGEEWQHADSIWGCVGYKDAADPFDNSYAADIMLATVAAYRAVKVCPKCHRPIRN